MPRTATTTPSRVRSSGTASSYGRAVSARSRAEQRHHRDPDPASASEGNASMTVRYDVADGVATVTLHRPEVRNAFGAGMGQALDDAYRRCDEDDAIRAVVLTGTPPAFCAGADMSSGGATFAKQDEATFSAAAT